MNDKKKVPFELKPLPTGKPGVFWEVMNGQSGAMTLNYGKKQPYGGPSYGPSYGVILRLGGYVPGSRAVIIQYNKSPCDEYVLEMLPACITALLGEGFSVISSDRHTILMIKDQ